MYYISVPLSVRTPQAQRRYVLYICAIIIENTSSTEMICIIFLCHYQWEHLVKGDGMYYISVPLSVRTPQARRWYVLYICAIIVENTSSTEMVCIIYLPLSVRTPQAWRWYVLYICAIIIENTSSTEMVCIIYMCHYHWEHLKHRDGMYLPLSVRAHHASI